MEPFTLTRQSLQAWCRRQQLEHDASEDHLVIPTPILDRPAGLLILFHDDRDLVTFAFKLPFTAPAERHDAVARGLNLLNSRTYLGAWVLNTDNGDVYFRATLPTRGTRYTDEAVHLTASAVVSTVDGAAAAIARVTLEGADPAAELDAG